MSSNVYDLECMQNCSFKNNMFIKCFVYRCFPDQVLFNRHIGDVYMRYLHNLLSIKFQVQWSTEARVGEDQCGQV